MAQEVFMKQKDYDDDHHHRDDDSDDDDDDFEGKECNSHWSAV